MTNRFQAKQDWSVGSTVKVGFLFFEVVRKLATPGDYRPDVFHLTGVKNRKPYTFQPHFGLEQGHTDGTNAI